MGHFCNIPAWSGHDFKKNLNHLSLNHFESRAPLHVFESCVTCITSVCDVIVQSFACFLEPNFKFNNAKIIALCALIIG